MRAPGNIVELRQILAERFPRAGTATARSKPDGTWPTGLLSLDVLLGGGLPRGRLTELIGDGPGSGSAQVIHALLRRTAEDRQFLALVDGADSFDVDAVEPDVLSRLLWVRCTQADEALKAADLLLRDRNFPFVILDLKLNPVAELQRISSGVWFRFNRLLEETRAAFLVITPHQLAGGAACRVSVESRLGLEALAQAPAEVLVQLRFTLLRSALPAAEKQAAQAG